MKNITFGFSVLLLLFASFEIVNAHFPTVTIDFIEQVPVVPGEDTEVEVPGFPYQLNFYGTVTHEGNGNLSRVELSATINDELIYGPEKLEAKGNQTTTNYVIPWIVERPGDYTLAITALHPENGAGEQGCKAAPAIAANYLKENDFPRGGEAKSVTTVAKETGINGEVWAKHSCESDYPERTLEIVVGTLGE